MSIMPINNVYLDLMTVFFKYIKLYPVSGKLMNKILHGSDNWRKNIMHN